MCEGITAITYLCSYCFFYLCIGTLLAGLNFDQTNKYNFIKCVSLFLLWPLAGLFLIGMKARKDFYSEKETYKSLKGTYL